MPDPFVKSVLAEIVRHLQTLAATGVPAAIDLRSLPLGADDRARLQAALGQGEVTITLQAAGRSEIYETAFPGVWWVRHFGTGDLPLTERIEIAAQPEAFSAAPEDFAAAAQRLAIQLSDHEVAHA